MPTRTRTTLSLIVGLLFLAGLWGCQPAQQAWRYAPSEQQASDWLARRELVIKVVYDIAEPMPGTTYHSNTQNGLDFLKSHWLNNEKYIRENIQLMDGFAEGNLTGAEFDVTVSDELMAEGKVCGKLADHYACRLADAGWHITGGGCSGTPNRENYTQIWTDLPGSHDRSGKSLSSATHCAFPDSARRGFFLVRIAVSLDKLSKEAHVMITYMGKIGKPASWL